LQTSRNLGPDWRNLFRRWVDDHKRYPRDAIMMNHQGPVTVRLAVAPDGLVRSVQLIGPNASPYLNSSLVHMFQGAHLPPLPPGADAGGEIITFTMRYILY
jgi:TonB family protein